MITIKRYSESDNREWNDFNQTSKNHLFMFDRNYMDYHSDRFTDNSLMFYNNGKLIALLPMNVKENMLISHGGLTYGGFITGQDMKQHIMNDCFSGLIEYAEDNSIKTIIYKSIPHIFCTQAAEEDRYSLFANHAKLKYVDASTYLFLKNPLKMPKGRKAQISRAKREGVEVEENNSEDSFERFICLENEVLAEHHGTSAVHTAAEIKMLCDRFPDNIHLYIGKKDGEIIAGTVIFEYDNVIHTQYMAANEEARRIGALDLVINTVIEKYRTTKEWLDFGISTERNRNYLNEGLISQKEGFGGRTGVYEIWEIDV